MKSLTNQHWTSLSGEPITGRIPTTLRIMNGVEPTPPQMGEIAHHYKLMTLAMKVSVIPYMVQERTLVDGTRVRMVSSYGVDTVMAWPTGGSSEGGDLLRGFVVSPLFVEGTPPPAAFDANFLVFINALNKWKPIVKGYRPGEKRQALAYSVSLTKWGGKPDSIKKSGWVFWPGKSIRGVRPVSDDKYNDVFALYGKTIYRNAVPVKTYDITIPDGTPVPFKITKSAGTRTWEEYSVTLVTDFTVVGVRSVGESPSVVVTGYDFAPFFQPYIAGRDFKSGVEVVRGTGASDNKARYLGYTELFTGAIHSWRATATVLADVPFATATETFYQLGVPGALADNDGWVTTSVSPLATPAVTSITARARMQGYLFDPHTGGYIGNAVGGAGPVTPDGAGNVSRVFNKTYSLPESIQITEEDVMDIARKVDIASETRTNSATYWNTWQTGTLCTYAYGPFAGTWVHFPLDTSGQFYYPGDTFGAAYSEVVSVLTHSDVAECVVSVPKLPATIYDVHTTHNINGRFGTGTNYELGQPESMTHTNGSPENTAAGQFIPKGSDFVGGSLASVYTNVGEKIGTNTIHAYARDYIYSDRTNEVFMWVEAEVISAATNEVLELGSSSVAIRTCIQFNGEVHKADIYAQSFGTPKSLGTLPPWGIGFGTSELFWGYHQPVRPAPIYAPVWQDQGLCPFIAYTTPSEHAEGVVPRIAAFFRLQLCRTVRGPDEPEMVVLPECTAFYPYMVEQLLTHYGGVNNAVIFNAFEAAPTIVKLAAPDKSLFANVGAPVNDAQQYAKFYRT